MTKTEIKQKTQDLLMHHMLNAWYAFDDNLKNMDSDDISLMNETMKTQINRVEKLFGYELNSWKA